jgi:succinate dehydrogenase / fumarate reductase cytochrome b subunit
MASVTDPSPSHSATQLSSSKTAPTHFLLRRLHSLTGILFGGYLIVHLVVNATLAQGAKPDDIYQAQVNKIHSLPLLNLIEWVFIYLPILYHTVYGIWITVTGQPNVGQYPFSKNIFYFFQRLTALILMLFIAFHIFAMKGLLGDALVFDPAHATFTATRSLTANWAIEFVVYPLGILCACYHLANGFWTAAITWGLTISRGAQKRWGLVCFGLFLMTFAFGMTAWLSVVLHPNPLK